MHTIALSILVCAIAFYVFWQALRRGGFDADRAMILMLGLLLALLAQHGGADGLAELLPASVLMGLAASVVAWLWAAQMRRLIVLALCLSTAQLLGIWGMVAAGCAIGGVLYLSPRHSTPQQLAGFLSLLLFLPVLTAILVHLEPGWVGSIPKADMHDVVFGFIVALVLLFGRRHSIVAFGTVALNVCVCLPLMLQV